jgi:hypothetical protein
MNDIKVGGGKGDMSKKTLQKNNSMSLNNIDVRDQKRS